MSWESRLTEGSETLRSIVRKNVSLPVGEEFYLVPNKGNDAFYKKLAANGVAQDKIFTTLASAYTNLTSGSGDTLYVAPGSYSMSAGLTWAKHYTNMIGLAAPVPINQRARFSSISESVSPLFTVSANGCVFENFMMSQDGSHATGAAINTYITGARNKFKYFTARNLGALAVVDDSCRALKLASTDGENLFEICTFGADTVDGETATNYVIEFAASGNQRQVFKGCYILGNGSANSSFILATAANSIDGSWIQFDRCLFSNPMAGDYDQMTQGFALDAACNGLIYFMDNLVHGAATLETTNSGVIIGRNAYAAATSDSGVALTF